ncbi:MAG: hypothetical protein CME06_06290 [Gemmatimonadetes bacterium]|nr:hypothetical protein [Gemmatimonadota bacterium]
MLAPIGLLALWRRRNLPIAVLLFVLLYYMAIGSANRGFPRYLSPLLPLIYVAAGAGFVTLLNHLREGRRELVAGALLVVVSVQGGARLLNLQRWDHSEMRDAYEQILALDPEGVSFAGYAPHVELEIAGIPTEQVSISSLLPGAREPTLALSPKSLLVVEKRIAEAMNPDQRDGLRLVWSTNKGYGQRLYALSAEAGE